MFVPHCPFMGAGVVGRYVVLWWLFVVVVDVDVPKTELQMSEIAAMIAVGSHTIAQSQIRTSFSKENSELEFTIHKQPGPKKKGTHICRMLCTTAFTSSCVLMTATIIGACCEPWCRVIIISI